jgi:hypothetical protein
LALPQQLAAKKMSYYGAPPGYAPPGPTFVNPWVTPGWAPRDPAAWALFQSVDTDRSGSIKLPELVVVRWLAVEAVVPSALNPIPSPFRQALTNHGWTKFGLRTARYLMRMFDADRSGLLGYQEFEQLMDQVGQAQQAQGAPTPFSASSAGAPLARPLRKR